MNLDCMKKTMFIFILLIFSSTLNAQFSEKNAIYFTSGLNVGNFWGGHLNLNYILDNKYSFQAGISALMREPKSKPEDFSSGLTGLLTLGLSDLAYYDAMANYQILVGRIFMPSKSSTTRFNIAAGIGYTMLAEATNWEYVFDKLSIGENYTYDMVTHSSLSFIIEPKVEFPSTRYFGFTLSPMLQINKDWTYIGVGIGVMVGLLRQK